MSTGRFKVGEDWYYAEASGVLARSRWVGDYYFHSDGRIAVSERVGGYWVGADGRWVRGA